MKILELNIIQFGKLSNRKIDLCDGLNIIEGDNESGKSTLLAFIKFMLYGLARKNPNIAIGERERALSWSQGIAQGSMTIAISKNGRSYRIERVGRLDARGAYSDKVKIIDLSSGEECFAGEVPGEHFLGIDANAYDSMCNIKQLEASSVSGESVKGTIDNLLSSGDESTSIQSAIKQLDIERRRLLHANGKGGLVFESECAVEKLKMEYKNSISHENECAKNRDDLARVEIQLEKASRAHNIARDMCDFHEDAIRLEKFEKMHLLESERAELLKHISSLDSSLSFPTELASYEKIAEIKSCSEALEKAEISLSEAEDEKVGAQKLLDSLTHGANEKTCELLDEFGSPKSALSHLESKKKKQKSTLSLALIFGFLGLALVGFGAFLVVKNIISGAITLAFMGAVLLGIAIYFSSKHRKAKSEILGFYARIDSMLMNADSQSILEHLEAFAKNRDAREKLLSSLSEAQIKLGIAKQNATDCASNAKNLLSSYNINAENDLCASLSTLANNIREFLAKRGGLEDNARHLASIHESLKKELEGYSEKAIRAKITPEALEKIQSTSLEALKAEREDALDRANRLNQYKAGLERTLAASGNRRSSAEIFPELENESEKLKKLTTRVEAIKLAMEKIGTASLSLKSDITPRIKDSAQQHLALATDGKYKELFIDENMSLSVFADCETRPIDSLSKGSLDLAYISVRLALVKTLLKDELPPLFMDEALSQLDNTRATNVLRTIVEYAKDSQCLLMTCQDRDAKLARGITTPNVIKM